ncbi:MAG: hypothetical protein KME35_13000 [Aphanocapsa sp. GSE-SYN-MK-11-07L]|nr:hypothetical protein [Aphanocapsa sp. GSE-SYN-MK-11-07L]
MLKRWLTVAGLIAVFAVVDGPVSARGVVSSQAAETHRESADFERLTRRRILGQLQPAVPALEQGGKVIEDKAAPLTEPPPNLQQADEILQQDVNVAKQESVSDMIQAAQDEDLLTDDYVGNPNYFNAAGGQRFGNEELWSWPLGLQPYTLGF